MDQANEFELLQRAQAGDQEAFESVLKPYLPMLCAYSRAICGDYHTAQDVVQETALIAYRRILHLFPEADFASWLKAIARRQAMAARRKLGRLNLGLVEQAIESVYDDLTPAATAPRREALDSCLSLLQGRLAQVVRAHYFQGSKLADLAACMYLTVNNVKQLLYRARRSLRDCIRQRLRQDS